MRGSTLTLTLALLAMAGCASTPATPQGDGSLTVKISAQRVANCKANGGCGLYSRNELLEMVKEAAEAGARQTCPAKSVVLL